MPFLAASLYKLFGVHEVFGRLITLGFSLATVATVTFFARWLFGSTIAGLAAGFFYAVFPGSIYYGRTFTPDCAMVFFLTAALYAAARTLLDRDALEWGDVLSTTALLALAYLAKPVAMLAIAPLIGLLWQRARAGRRTPLLPIALLVAAPVFVFWLYDRSVASYAEWHWASGITKLHVLPALSAALSGLPAFAEKLTNFRIVLGMLRDTMLGGVAFLLSIAAFIALPWIPARSKALLWAWLAGGLLYVFVVVTVERVNYYMYPLLPLCALSIGGLFARVVNLVRGLDAAPTARYALLALVALVAAVALGNRTPVAAYYGYNASRISQRARTSRRAPAGFARRHRPLRTRLTVLSRPLRLGRGPHRLDAVRRRERDRQGCALLHLHRRPAPAPQPRALRVASALPGRRVRRLARVSDVPGSART